MSINYVVRKKVDKTGEKEKIRYYAMNRAVQGKGKGVNEEDLAHALHAQSSLSKGDAMSVFAQLPDLIARFLREGRTVTISKIGTFYPSVTSEGYETPEECTADKVWVNRVCFKNDPYLLQSVRKEKFFCMEFVLARREKAARQAEESNNIHDRQDTIG